MNPLAHESAQLAPGEESHSRPTPRRAVVWGLVGAIFGVIASYEGDVAIYCGALAGCVLGWLIATVLNLLSKISSTLPG